MPILFLPVVGLSERVIKEGGTASREYGDSIHVGDTATYRLDGLLEDVMYYIAVTAYDVYGNESGFSDEVSSDTAGNAMPDAWETEYFGDTSQEPEGDYDGDGLNNLGEYQHGCFVSVLIQGYIPRLVFCLSQRP